MGDGNSSLVWHSQNFGSLVDGRSEFPVRDDVVFSAGHWELYFPGEVVFSTCRSELSVLGDVAFSAGH